MLPAIPTYHNDSFQVTTFMVPTAGCQGKITGIDNVNSGFTFVYNSIKQKKFFNFIPTK